MPSEHQTLTDLATWFIDGPLMALLLFAVALATATLLVRFVPAVRRTVSAMEMRRNTAIDGLRGVLGISVFVHHTVINWFLLHGSGWELPPSRFVVHLGQTSVVLFFMITAFLFWGRVLDRGPDIDWAEFLVSRLYRLYPVYLLMLGLVILAVVALTWSGPPFTLGAFVTPLLDWLLFAIFGAPNINGLANTGQLIAWVVWSLGYEWLFYLALPLLGFLAWRSRQPVAAVLSAAALLAIFAVCGWQSPFYIEILQGFLGGMVAAHWVRDPVLAAVSRTTAAGLVGIAGLAAVVVGLSTAYTWQATVGLTLFFVAIASGHGLWGLLRLPGLLWLGDITYSIYLLHGLLLGAVFQHLLPRAAGMNGLVFIASAVLVDIVLVTACSLVFLKIERPGILLGKRHYRFLERLGSAMREMVAAW